jgi:hypothetical protein
MKNVLRNVTLTAAALVAALAVAPKSEAQERFRGRESGRFERHEVRRFDRNRGFGRDGRLNRDFRRFDRDDRRFFPRHFAPGLRYGAFHSVAPFRVFRGVRFYSYCPGPAFVYINDGDYAGWVYPPYAGAVWAPGFYDRFGIWIGGHWRG